MLKKCLGLGIVLSAIFVASGCACHKGCTTPTVSNASPCCGPAPIVQPPPVVAQRPCCPQ
jgi:hypothetical protein